jgi:alcohol dehydrogenase class IV
MTDIQINEDLFKGVDYFATQERRRELVKFFQFERRRVILGEGALDTLGAECRGLEAQKVLLVRDPGVVALEGLVRTVLEREGIEVVGLYEGIIPNPSVESVDRFADFIKGVECDAVIALGGGSTLDTVKTGLCASTAGGSIADYFGFDLFQEPARWPLIGIPTTAGTGAEVSRVSVVADEGGKQAVYSDYLTPKVALVDPRLSRDLPSVLTATTGLDALGHALECTASQKSNALGDAVAREALRVGCPGLVRAITEGARDPEARYRMARCSLLAGLLLSPINTGAAHALGYGIEKLSHEAGKPVPHGTAVGLVLPGVMQHNMPAAADKYYYAAGVAGQDLAGKSREEGIVLAANWVDQLRRRHTPYGSLADAGLGAADIPRMVEVGLSIRRLMDHNPVEVKAQDAERIYRGVLE